MGLLQRFSPICRAKRAVTALSLGCACSRNVTVRLVSKHWAHCATTSVKRSQCTPQRVLERNLAAGNRKRIPGRGDVRFIMIRRLGGPGGADENHKFVSNGDHDANLSSQEMQLVGSPQAMQLARSIAIFLVARRCLLISLKLWGHRLQWHLHTVGDGSSIASIHQEE